MSFSTELFIFVSLLESQSSRGASITSLQNSE